MRVDRTAAPQERDAPAPERAGPARAEPVQRILALQRTAGNRASIAALRIDRKVSALSPSLFWKLEGRELQFEQIPGLDPNNFETQMMALVNQDAVLPMRMTNRHGLLGDRVAGFHDSVDGDAFTSGYVDIDDLLAGDDLGFQMLLVHFLTERAATSNYARRIGTDFSRAEFDRGHRLGIEAEAEILRAFFGDPSIRIVADSPSVTVRRVFRNSRGHRIRRRIRLGRGDERGVHASSVDVVVENNVVLTAEEYRARLEQERTAAQVERERLGGADEHRAGGRGVPAP